MKAIKAFLRLECVHTRNARTQVGGRNDNLERSSAGGIVVALWTTGTVAFVPDSITIAAGSTTGTFTVTTNYTSSTLKDIIRAFYNGRVRPQISR